MDIPTSTNNQTISQTTPVQIETMSSVAKPISVQVGPQVQPKVEPGLRFLRSKWFIILFLVLLVITLALIGVYFMLKTSGNGVVSETPTPTPADREIVNPRVIPSADPFAKWKIYKNNLIGYEVKYSPEMVVINSDINRSRYDVNDKTTAINIVRVDEIDGTRQHKISVKTTKIERGFDYDLWQSAFKSWELTNKKETTKNLNGIDTLIVEGNKEEEKIDLYYKIYAFKNVVGQYAVALFVQYPVDSIKKDDFEKAISTFVIFDTTPSPSPSATPATRTVPPGFMPDDF